MKNQKQIKTNNKLIEGRIIGANKSFLKIKCNNGAKGLVHISEVSDYYVSNLHKEFNQGQKYWFLILEKDKKNNVLKLNWKNLYPRFLKDPFQFEIKETKNGFQNLRKNTLKELKND